MENGALEVKKELFHMIYGMSDGNVLVDREEVYVVRENR